MSWAKSEVEVARLVVQYLQDQKWDVYQEVGGPAGTADIVARFGKRLWVIECKQALNLTVMEQADRWKPYAHMVSVAIPVDGKERAQFEFGKKCCAQNGIGVLEVRDPSVSNIMYSTLSAKSEEAATAFRAGQPVHQTVDPTLFRKPLQGLADLLRPQHKTYCEAGTASGKRWTPFKETALAVRNFVWKNPGVDAHTLVKSIKHHYRQPVTAVVQLVDLAERGVIEGVRVERQYRKILFFPQVAGLRPSNDSAKPVAAGQPRAPERRAATTAKSPAAKSAPAPTPARPRTIQSQLQAPPRAPAQTSPRSKPS